MATHPVLASFHGPTGRLGHSRRSGDPERLASPRAGQRPSRDLPGRQIREPTPRTKRASGTAMLTTLGSANVLLCVQHFDLRKSFDRTSIRSDGRRLVLPDRPS